MAHHIHDGGLISGDGIHELPFRNDRTNFRLQRETAIGDQQTGCYDIKQLFEAKQAVNYYTQYESRKTHLRVGSERK